MLIRFKPHELSTFSFLLPTVLHPQHSPDPPAEVSSSPTGAEAKTLTKTMRSHLGASVVQSHPVLQLDSWELVETSLEKLPLCCDSSS